jgi:ferredoxin
MIANCNACGLCAPLCPNEAIAVGERYRIRTDKCTECYGFHSTARCALTCPIGGIMLDPANPERTATLLEKFRRWHPEREPAETENWEPWED